MRFTKKLLLKTTLVLIITSQVARVYAQDAAVTTKNTTSPNNQLAILMVVIAILLAFVIWGLGQVLVTIGRQALEKSKQQNKTMPVVMLIGLSLLSVVTKAQNTNTVEQLNTVPNYGGIDATAFWILASVISIELIAIAFIMFSIRRIQTELLPQKENAKKIALEEWWSRLDKKLFTKAVAVEKEADILLDHDYDGIKELDNALPPWWKYGFIITIVIAFIYLINFHVLGYGKNPAEEYQQELADAQQAKEVYEMKSSNSADKVDESNLKMPDATGIAGGKDIFMSVCWTCHGKMGEGGAGPNLTDEYWIHKGSLTDIYLSIKHGYPEKGMQAWVKNYSPKEMNNLAGFIKTLKGTNPPNPKAAQGDIYTEKDLVDTLVAKPIIAKDSAAINAGNIIKK